MVTFATSMDYRCEAIEPIIDYPYSFEPDVHLNSFRSVPRNMLYFNDDAVCKQGDIWTYYTYDDEQRESFIKTYFPDKMESYLTHGRMVFVYLWMYKYGGVYISSQYELLKPIEEVIDRMKYVDLYFMLDNNRYVSDNIFASQEKCKFWLDSVDNIGKRTLTDMMETTKLTYEFLPRWLLDPYTVCDRHYTKDSYLRPTTTNSGIVAYMKCATKGNNERMYMVTGIFIVIIIMIIAAVTAS